MSLINISDLTFAYEGGEDNIFDNVSFQIDTDWRLGFIGRNGRGKTTFLNLLQNKYEYRGSISASTDFEYFPYQVEDKSLPTLEILEGVNHDFQGWELTRELNLLQVDNDALYRPFGTLSNGEQTKVLLAAVFLKENCFLLIDEPTNHLDLNGRKLVSEYLKTKKGFILVSHDRAFLDGCIDHVLSINKADIEIQKGNFSTWLINKERRDSFELAENEKLSKEIKRLEKAAKEKAVWSDKIEKSKIGGHSADRGYIGHKSAKMMKRSKAIENRQQDALENKSKLLKNIEESAPIRIRQLDFYSSRLLSLDGITIRYGDKPACENISFTVDKGDRIWLSGRNGSGKSSVIKLICGEDIPYDGEFKKSGRLKISYVSQDTSFLSGGLSEYAAQSGVDESLLKAILRKLDFSRGQFDKDIGDFSGGQKKKLLIAKSLCEEAHLHIWDEPLNFIDIISRMQIENLIIEFKPTILFVEHDASFSKAIATKTIEFA